MLARASVSAILEAWLRAAVQSYPAETGRHLLSEPDEFRNPVGHALREALPVLLEAAMGRVPAEDATAPLERLMRIRAVQDLRPSQAVGFLFQLIPLISDQGGIDPTIQDRVNGMALQAFDLYTACREQMHAIQVKELRRYAGQTPRCAPRPAHRPESEA